MGRALALGAVIVFGGCAIPQVTSPPFTTPVLGTRFQGDATVLVVSPWPLEPSIAYLCRRPPGEEFTATTPVPAAAAECIKLETARSGEDLEARFDSTALPPDVGRDFGATGPWFVAVAGGQGPSGASAVLSLENSPIFSPPGPS